MTDPESTSLLRQAEALAQAEGNRLGAQVTTDGASLTAEASVSHTAAHWWVRAWARLTGRPGALDRQAGVSGGIRWFGGWDR